MRLVLAAVCFVGFSVNALAAQVPAVSTVDAVTVFLSGAEVTRIAKAHLDKGEHTIIVSDVSASAVPGSIRVEGRATGKLDIGSVDTARKLLQQAESESADAQRKMLEDKIQALKDQKTTIDAQAQAAKTQKKLIGNLAQLPMRRASASEPGTSLDDWTKVLALIAQGTTDASKLALDAEQKTRQIDRQIADVNALLSSLAPTRTEQTELRIHVIAQSPLDVDLSIHYQVPDARWVPLYDARLSTGSKTEPPRLSLDRRAEITQLSGEDWNGVTMELSTARPSDGSSAPDLETQLVDFEPEAKPVATMSPPPSPAPTLMAKRSAAAELDAAPALGGQANAPMEAAETVAQIKSAPFDATFAVQGRVTIAATGEPKRVLLSTEDSEPVLGCRAAPKVDANAYLYANIKVTKGLPMLPGTVYLFRDGTFVGAGDLPLLRPGEDHDIGFGVDDQVKVKHSVLEDKRGETGLISTSHVDSRNFQVNVKNLHERAIDVTILDRVPISQNDDIKVEVTGRASPTTQNVDGKRGVIAFTARLEPDEEKILEYGYRVSWPAAKSIVYGP
ncbi:mucoidy inhibitor MuiA family protein [Hyphomicrobium sp.]|jgi:uncharacterized protein (TIGR02231 family)|uniref:mucoidy inhibitor MuiA family protein n=1 Tax=Hyphomicrobium sp. TaxID=82 RepID=UPI0035648FAF